MQKLLIFQRISFRNPIGRFIGSTPNVNSCGEPIIEKHIGSSGEKVASYGEIIVEKIHGLGEKLLGHHRSDSDTSSRAKPGKFRQLLIFYLPYIHSNNRHQ